MNSSD